MKSFSGKRIAKIALISIGGLLVAVLLAFLRLDSAARGFLHQT